MKNPPEPFATHTRMLETRSLPRGLGVGFSNNPFKISYYDIYVSKNIKHKPDQTAAI